MTTTGALWWIQVCGGLIFAVGVIGVLATIPPWRVCGRPDQHIITLRFIAVMMVGAWVLGAGIAAPMILAGPVSLI